MIRVGFAPWRTGDLVADKRYKMMCEWLQPVMFFDRSGANPPVGGVTNVCPLPEGTGPVGTFEAEMLGRAWELASLERTLNVMWSGGIDSTSILAALIAAGVPRDQVRVTCTAASVAEYPEFYDDVVSKMDHELVVGMPLRAEGDDIIVTGELGDQIFGTDRTFAFGDDTPWRPWRDVVPEFAIELVEPVLARLPRETKTFADFTWAVSFVMKWQGVKFRKLVDNPAQFRTVHFFDSPELEAWSMRTDEPKLLDSQATYKWPAKKLIHSVHPCERYRDTKMKTASIIYTRRLRPIDVIELHDDGVVRSRVLNSEERRAA